MYFEIRKRAPAQYWWRIKANGNNEILATSEILVSKAGCINAINIVRAYAGGGSVYDETGER